MELEKIIQDTLTVFVQSHIPAADLSGLDDIVFSYVTSVLEELGSPEPFEETFDMETFLEMMEAYIPGFAEINSDKVYEMMISLSEKLHEAQRKSAEIEAPGCISAVPVSETAAQKTLCHGSRLLSEDVVEGGISSRRSRSPVKGAGAQEPRGGPEDSIEMLMEMFPACTVSQAREAFSVAQGNLEEAAQLILEEKVPRDAVGAFLQEGSRPQKSRKQNELKEFILQKYMMVDSDEDGRTYRPAPPKEAPKKLVRYINNQVVSTRGERYKDIKAEESEEMKRTYINLKPARKYKFH